MVNNLQSINHSWYDTGTIPLVLLLIVCIAALVALRWGKPLADYLRRRKLSVLKYSSWEAATGYVFGKTNLGRIAHSPIDREGIHTLYLGGTGTGKTSAGLVPTLSHFDGNFLAIDISGDISAAVEKPGSLAFAPCEAATSLYNVFGIIDALAGNVQAQHEQLEKLAYLLMPDIPGASDASLYFNTEGRKILTAALSAFYFAGLDFCDICRMIVASSPSELFRAIDALENEAASMLINSFRGTSEANTSGCAQNAATAVKLFATNENLRKSLRRPVGCESSITPASLESHSVFLNIPEAMLDVYAPLLRIIVSQHLAYFSGRSIGASPALMLALDEFPSLSIDATAIVSALQRFRKRNVSIMVVAQSMVSLDRIYGPVTRKDMLNNFTYKVVLHAGDADTQLEIARMIGHKTEQQITRTSGRSGTSTTVKDEQVWAVEPEELSRLNNHLILIHPAGYEKLKKTPYYKYKQTNPGD